jgi:hypothetical protein
MSLWEFLFGKDDEEDGDDEEDTTTKNTELEQSIEDESTEGEPHSLEGERGYDGEEDTVLPDYASESETEQKPSNGGFWRSFFGLN